MPSGGDVSYQQKINSAFEVDYDLAAAATGPIENLVVAKSPNHQTIIQHIIVSVYTYSNKVLTFQDDAGTPVVIGAMTVPASAGSASGNQPFTMDFLSGGTKLTKGKNLDLTLSGAGVAARIHIEGYYKLVGPVSVAQAAVGG